MSPEYHDEPLRRFPATRTKDPEVMREVLLSRFGAIDCNIPADPEFFARVNIIECPTLALSFCGYGSQAKVQFRESDFVRLQLGLKGFGSANSAGVSTEIHPECSCISSPNKSAILDFGDGYEQLVLRLPSKTLEEKLIRMVGFRPKGALHFNPMLRSDQPHAQSLRQLVMFFAGQLQEHAPTLPAQLVAELEEAITVSFLHASRHSHSALLDIEAKDAAPAHVRRAEEYIEANWNVPLTIERLTDATNVSSRTLLRAFLKHRGCTPHAFVKQTRLNRAKQMLERGDPATSVTSVAFACGFGNPGHFAKDFRLTFGELPSETLATARQA